jgi:hypothetical protein
MTSIPWFRFIAITTINWVVNLFLVSIFLVYVIPRSIHGYGLAVVVWVLSSLIAFVFAHWAFHPRMPGRTDTVALCVIWFFMTIAFQAFWEMYQYGQLVFFFLNIDLLGAVILQIVAIVLASYISRRHRLRSTLGEGMEV